MRKLSVFDQVSLDGFFADANGEMNFAHKDDRDPEWNTFVSGNASGGDTLLFGRITYQMMAGFWSSPLAAETMPVVAERMNALSKVVFSRTLREASWKNTKLIDGDLAGEVRKLKNEAGGDVTILGSGSIVAQLTQHGLIDEYMIVVVPVVLGSGRTLFEGVTRNVAMRLTGSRVFNNGNVVLTYVPSTVGNG
jgi:dihydrofolate reductase